MTRAAILVERGFQDEVFVYPYYRMQEEGWTVDVASPDGKERSGKFGVPARVTRSVAELIVASYDLVVLPGGFENPDRLRMRKDVQQFVRGMNHAGKLVAAICHAPSILISSSAGGA